MLQLCHHSRCTAASADSTAASPPSPVSNHAAAPFAVVAAVAARRSSHLFLSLSLSLVVAGRTQHHRRQCRDAAGAAAAAGCWIVASPLQPLIGLCCFAGTAYHAAAALNLPTPPNSRRPSPVPLVNAIPTPPSNSRSSWQPPHGGLLLPESFHFCQLTSLLFLYFLEFRKKTHLPRDGVEDFISIFFLFLSLSFLFFADLCFDTKVMDDSCWGERVDIHIYACIVSSILLVC